MSYTQLQAKTVVTRKGHRCVCCRGVFAAGAKMEYVACVYDGQFQSQYCCKDCCEDYRQVVADDPTDWPEWEWSEMWVAVRELRADRERQAKDQAFEDRCVKQS